MATLKSTLLLSLNAYCSLGNTPARCCRKCLAHTLVQWGYDAKLYDRECIRVRDRKNRRVYLQRGGAKLLLRARHQRRALMYGISDVEYDAKMRAQDGVCALCGQPETRMTGAGVLASLCVDHDHRTGAIRGLLCSRCNSNLDMAERLGPSWLAMVREYLAFHGSEMFVKEQNSEPCLIDGITELIEAVRLLRGSLSLSIQPVSVRLLPSEIRQLSFCEVEPGQAWMA